MMIETSVLKVTLFGLVALCAGGCGGVPDGAPVGGDRRGQEPMGKGIEAPRENCLLISETWDGSSDSNPADGAPDTRITYTYDADGHRLTTETDHGADGVLDRRVNSIYDAGGYLIAEESDGDQEVAPPDGTLDSLTQYRYDSAGREVSATHVRADGSVAWRSSRTYDAAGRLLTIVGDGGAKSGTDGPLTDFPPDGQADDRSSRFYDENGMLVSVEFDGGFLGGPACDGIVDQRESSHYDAKGRLSTKERDGDCDLLSGAPDGRVDERTTYVYDDADRVVREERDGDLFSVEPGVDGIADEIVTYAYDAYGNKVTATATNAGGMTIGVSQYVWDCH